MGLLGMLAALAAFGIVGFAIFILYQIRKTEKRFKDNKVPYLGLGISRVYNFFTGKVSMFEVESLIYKEAKQTRQPIVAFCDNLVTVSYYVTDLDLCRSIYVKDFDHFVDRRKFDTQNPDDLLNKMLISLESDHWKGLRSKLSPAFTTGKIRRMFKIFDTCSHKMCDYLKTTVGPNGGEYDISEAYSKYAMDVIASCAFGVDSKSFECKTGNLSEFEDMAQRFQFRFSPKMFIKFVLIFAAPKLANALGIAALDTLPQKYFMGVVKSVLKHRRETGERQDDFLQLMMDIQQGLYKDEESSKESLEVMTGSEGSLEDSKNHFQSNNTALSFEDDDIVANCVLFLIGGFDTTQSLLILAAYQLALEQDCQEKLRGFVREAMEKNDGKLTYDAIHGMTYLDNFINGKELINIYYRARQVKVDLMQNDFLFNSRDSSILSADCENREKMYKGIRYSRN